MARVLRRTFAWLTLLAATLSFAADPVAFISDTRGEVVLDGVGRPPFLAELLPGSRLVLGAGASAAVMYVVSGEEYALTGPGEFVVKADGVVAAKGTPPARRTTPVRVSASTLVQTSRAATASLRMRSAPAPKGGGAGPLYPVNARIATLQPTLRWHGEAGAEYSVVVTSADGREFFRGKTKGAALKLPARLAPGQSYVWGYSGAARGESRFETLAADSVAVADKARAQAKSFADRVALALVLQDLGASQDSREVWAELALERPDIPELAGLAR